MAKKKKPPPPNFLRIAFFWMLIFMGIVWVANMFNAGMGGLVKTLPYNEFYERLEENMEKPTIESARLIENKIEGKFTENTGGGYFRVYIPQQDEELIPLLREKIEKFEVDPPRTLWAQLFISLFPVVLFILFLWYFSYKGSQVGSRVWSFSRARTHIIEKGKTPQVTFRDVAGIDTLDAAVSQGIELLEAIYVVACLLTIDRDLHSIETKCLS